ncbi:hypothetical protein MN608_03002 [Microdochium nivale]|nr:hypothetical protein MN608_03002 [Microdochium nivale]
MAFLSPSDMLLIGAYVILSTCVASAATSTLIQYWRGRVDTWAPSYQGPWAHNPVVILAIWVAMLVVAHIVLPIAIILAMYCFGRFLGGATSVGWMQLRPKISLVTGRQRMRREADERARREREYLEGRFIRDENRPSVVQELQEYAASFDRPPRYTREEAPPPAFFHEELQSMPDREDQEEATATFYRQDAPPAYLPTIWEESDDEMPRRGSKAEEAEEVEADITRPEPAMLRRVVAERQ